MHYYAFPMCMHIRFCMSYVVIVRTYISRDLCTHCQTTSIGVTELSKEIIFCYYTGEVLYPSG